MLLLLSKEWFHNPLSSLSGDSSFNTIRLSVPSVKQGKFMYLIDILLYNSFLVVYRLTTCVL